jgi:hypothetical protein
MSRKTLAQVALLGALVAGGLGYQGITSTATVRAAHLGAAQPALKTYADAAHGFSFQYPATWHLQKGVKTAPNYGKIEATLAPTAVQIAAPDQLALGAVLVHKGSTSTSAIKATEKALLNEDNKPLSKLSYSVKSINGVKWPFSEMLVTASGGGTVKGDAFVAATAHGAYTYYFLGAVVTNKSSAASVNARTQEIAGVIASFTFM